MPRLAVLAATAGGAFGALVTLVPIGGRTGATVGTRVLRATAVAGTMAIAATAWIGRDLSELAAQPVVFGLAYLAFALAVAIRFGAIPFHGWAARLTDAVPEIDPAARHGDRRRRPSRSWPSPGRMRRSRRSALDLDSVRLVVLAIAIASIVLASVAAFIQDDIEHIVGYAIIGDAGVVLLAVAALDPAAWAPARTWILAFVVARSAFAAWAAATRTTFHTGRVDDLRGWALRSPALGCRPRARRRRQHRPAGARRVRCAAAAIIQLALDGPLAAMRLARDAVARSRTTGGCSSSAPDRTGGMPRRRLAPGRRPLDLDRPPAWLRRAWADNLARHRDRRGARCSRSSPSRSSAGAFGGPQAAAGLPPALGQRESFGRASRRRRLASDAPTVERHRARPSTTTIDVEPTGHRPSRRSSALTTASSTARRHSAGASTQRSTSRSYSSSSAASNHSASSLVGGLRPVRRVDDVLGRLEREVAADRARAPPRAAASRR